MSLSVHQPRVHAALALLFGLLATPARAQTTGANGGDLADAGMLSLLALVIVRRRKRAI